ncbi:toll/interleukin-1 receptor domain-containing protein [Kibdelosporangium lantanae]|uniref:Toll/interleukin-1 receptor domain-containing protein n=1 Tax=Kibdelosporangium lantanae TaxID=1497396 RepID=A0ABW3M317_9PSEU
MAGIFISYRVQDEPFGAALIDSELSKEFASDLVFIANRSLRSGDDFESIISHAMRNSDAFLVIIGPRWFSAGGEWGEPFIYKSDDWLRRQIVEAFMLGIRVIPVLLGSDVQIRSEQLSPEISRLARLRPVRIRMQSLNADLSNLVKEIRRVVPRRLGAEDNTMTGSRTIKEVSIWTSDDDGEHLRDAVRDLLEVAGFEPVDQAYPIRGSWFQRIFVRQREMDSVGKLAQLAERVERAAELRYIGAPRSENDEREASAIARLVDALARTNEAVIRTSSILLIKVNGRILSWALTEDEVKVLNANPHLMRSPMEMLEALPNLQRIVNLTPDWDTGQISDPPAEPGSLQ